MLSPATLAFHCYFCTLADKDDRIAALQATGSSGLKLRLHNRQLTFCASPPLQQLHPTSTIPSPPLQQQFPREIQFRLSAYSTQQLISRLGLSLPSRETQITVQAGTKIAYNSIQLTWTLSPTSLIREPQYCSSLCIGYFGRHQCTLDMSMEDC